MWFVTEHVWHLLGAITWQETLFRCLIFSEITCYYYNEIIAIGTYFVFFTVHNWVQTTLCFQCSFDFSIFFCSSLFLISTTPPHIFWFRLLLTALSAFRPFSFHFFFSYTYLWLPILFYKIFASHFFRDV